MEAAGPPIKDDTTLNTYSKMGVDTDGFSECDTDD